MKAHHRARTQGVRTEVRESVQDQKPGQKENGTMARNKGSKWGVSEVEPRGAGGAQDRSQGWRPGSRIVQLGPE